MLAQALSKYQNLKFILKLQESPRWLILRGKEFSASQSLEWLRGRNDVAIDREIEKIKRDIASR